LVSALSSTVSTLFETPATERPLRKPNFKILTLAFLASCLLLNAIAILSEDRFLARSTYLSTSPVKPSNVVAPPSQLLLEKS
jgi:hypothetical protein